MSGIFPNPADGGLLSNLADPTNPSHAYPPIIQPAGTAPLYYGNGCDVRLRPEVVNSLISEVAALCDAGELSYVASRLTNAELATRYMIQRGRPRGTLLAVDLAAGAIGYTAALDPPATRYSDFMTLSVVPAANNQGNDTLNLNGLGRKPIKRNNGDAVFPDDMLADIPLELIYYDNAFYIVGQIEGASGTYDVVRQPCFMATTTALAPTNVAFKPSNWVLKFNDMGDATFDLTNGDVVVGNDTKGIWALFMAGIPLTTDTNKHNMALRSSWGGFYGNIIASQCSDVDNGGGYSTHVGLSAVCGSDGGTMFQFTHQLLNSMWITIVQGGVRIAGGN